MNKTKMLGGLVVVLLLLNLFLLFFRPPHARRHNHQQIIIEKLGLTAPQIQEYELSIAVHQKAIRNLQEELKKNKSQLYEILAEDNISSEKTTFLLQEISQTQQKIEAAHFTHFKSIKELCNESQKEKFAQLTKELSKMFASDPMPPKQ